VRASWEGTLRAAGVSAAETEELAPSFAYPGFRYTLDGVAPD